jgi:hypothetical protein
MTEFEAKVLADLSVLKTQMKDLLGNGHPGRVAQMESRLLDHERAVQRLKGMAAAFAAMLTIVHTATDLFLRHHA